VTIFRRYYLGLLILFLILSNVFIWREVLATPEENNLKVYFLDVGQGDATFIESPNGNQVLIDGGPMDNSVLRSLGEVMPISDRSIDMVIATHPDADHIGGIAEILNRYDVGMYIESGNRTKDTKTFSALQKTVEEKENQGMKVKIASRGERYILDEQKGVYLDILFPDKDVSNVESNLASIVVKLSMRESCFIFMGDAPKSTEAHLIFVDDSNLDCEVLKAGHHGSRTSSMEDFVRMVSPQYVVISSGKNNRYGHPHKEVIDIFKKLNIEILRTDEMGTVEIDSDGVGVSAR
jgi:competence protein ComEC